MLSYPRLSRSLTLIEAGRIREQVSLAGVQSASRLARVHHEHQRPVATGRIATAIEIGDVRTQIVEAVGPLMSTERITDKAKFDRELGAALHNSLEIVPSDAAHEETWNFLSSIVFPDVIAFRFANIPDDRVLGGHRNVLRKAWIRHEILGAELLSLNLKEDELVGLFERTALVRNRRLTRLAARAVAEHSGPSRDVWARKFYKMITFQTGVRLLDSIDDQALQSIIETCAAGANSIGLQTSELGSLDY